MEFTHGKITVHRGVSVYTFEKNKSKNKYFITINDIANLWAGLMCKDHSSYLVNTLVNIYSYSLIGAFISLVFKDLHA